MKDLPTSSERVELCPNVSFPSAPFSTIKLSSVAHMGAVLAIRGDSVSGTGEMVLLSHKGSIPWCSHSARITIAHSPLQHSSAEITVLLRLLQALKVI